jgi:hypothetical protein
VKFELGVTAHQKIYHRHRRPLTRPLIISLALYIAVTFTSTLTLPREASAQQSEHAEPLTETLDDKLLLEAQEYLIKGQDALTRNDFSVALTCFINAQRLSPDIKNLITIAGIHQRRGDCPSAYSSWIAAIKDCQNCKYKDAIFKRFIEGTRPCTSTLNVTSMPSAQVKLDSVELWRTPMSIPALHGSHILEVAEPGYLSTARRVLVDPSQERIDVDVTLYLATASEQMGPAHAPSRADWARDPAGGRSSIRLKAALGLFAVSVVGTGFTTYSAILNEPPARLWLLGGLSASFLLGGFVLMP